MPRKTKSATEKELAVRVGRNIKVVRTKRGITQSELAETLEVDSVTVSRIETGAQLPSIDRLSQISEILNVPLAVLLADLGKEEAFGDLVAEVTKDLPSRERDFIYNFIVSYVQHWKSGKKGK
jgi:transcriptional regulator with XRE-family HTH domain